MKIISSILDWIKANTVKSVVGGISIVTSVFGLIQMLRGDSTLGLLLLLFSIWLILLYISIYVAFYTIPSPVFQGRRIYKYQTYRPVAFISIVLETVILFGVFLYEPSKSFISTAFHGTSTPAPSATPIPTSTSTPTPPDITMLVTMEEGNSCEFVGNQRSIIDVAINNNSDRNIMLTTVKLIPHDVSGCFYAGELAPVETYPVIVDQWYEASRCPWDDDALEPAPIFVEDIPQNKYTIMHNEAERFQIILGLTDSNAYLTGTISLEINTDSGTTLVSGPHEIAVCVPDGIYLSYQNSWFGVSSLAFSHDAKQLAAGYGDGSLILWNPSTMERIAGPVHLYNDWIAQMEFTQDGKYLVSRTTEEIYISETTKLDTVIGPLTPKLGMMTSLAIHPNSKQLVTGNDIGMVTIWNLESGQEMESFNASANGTILDLEFSTDGKKLASGDSGGNYTVWDMDHGSIDYIFTQDDWMSYSTMDISLETNRIIASGYNATLFDFTSQTQTDLEDSYVGIVAFDSAGSKIAMSSKLNQQIKILNINDLQTAKVLFHPYLFSPTCLVFAPNQDILASCGIDGSIALWDVEEEKLITTIKPVQ